MIALKQQLQVMIVIFHAFKMAVAIAFLRKNFVEAI